MYIRNSRKVGVTPVKVDRLKFFLHGYDSALASYLIDGFRFGFRVHFVGEQLSYESPNLKSAIDQPDLASLSSGSRASMRTESKIIPANCKTESGPTVFSGARGTPIFSHKETKFDKSRVHWSLVGAMKRKSSKMCKTD